MRPVPGPCGRTARHRSGGTMPGVYYDRVERRLRLVADRPEDGWVLLTHNLNPSRRQCERILAELVPLIEMSAIDRTELERRAEPGSSIAS